MPPIAESIASGIIFFLAVYGIYYLWRSRSGGDDGPTSGPTSGSGVSTGGATRK